MSRSQHPNSENQKFQLIRQKLKLIIWKNFIIRKHHYILTILEALVPTLLFFLIAYGRSEVTGLNKEVITKPTINDKFPIDYNSADTSDTFMYFTAPPQDSNFYKKLIKLVQIKQQLINNNIEIFDSETELLQYYQLHASRTTLAVIFTGTKTQFAYTLRYHDGNFVWNTDKLYRELPNGMQLDSDYVFKGLVAVQKALDTSYIELMSNKTISDDLDLSIEIFPYPPYIADSNISSFFMYFLPFMTLLSFISICPTVIKRVVEEKESGAKELMKMVGLKSWMLWFGWFIHAIVPVIISLIIVTILMKVPLFGEAYPTIEFTNGFVFFMFLLFYAVAIIMFCFAISTLFSKPAYAVTFGVLAYLLSYIIPTTIWESDDSLSTSLKMCLGLFPNYALYLGYSVIFQYEKREIGVQISNLFLSAGGNRNELSMAHVFGIFILDAILYLMLAFYLDSVNPGPYGIKTSIFYPYKLLKQYFNKSNNTNKVSEEPLNTHIEEDVNLRAAIEIEAVSKKYDNKFAVDNLNLKIYKDQITVLLGHNGAGKSTTMSMICGMTGTTRGTIRANGKDIKTNLEEFRTNLGLCPQDNLLFTDLTVEEHLVFFAGLKGKTFEKARDEANVLMKKLNIHTKAKHLANTLSGGMKRKLCLGMAIIGGSKVLILDEPTSGMDPESRREVWNMLLDWRKSRTILITTHFMEEADALGDRIAIMSQGFLQCFGTPMFLKNKYNTGYHLSLIFYNAEDAGTFKQEVLVDVKTFISNAEIKNEIGNVITIQLPVIDKEKLLKMFQCLETKKETYRINLFSLALTTLEDVFLKANRYYEEDDAQETEEELKALPKSDRHETESLKYTALLRKRWSHLKSRYYQYLIPYGITLLIFVLNLILCNLSGSSVKKFEPELDLALSTYGLSTVYYNSTDETLSNLYENIVKGEHAIVHKEDDIEEAIIAKAIQNIIYYKKHLIVASQFTKNSDKIAAVALYSSEARHSAPISVNLLTNTLAKFYLGPEYSISLSNSPLPSYELLDTHNGQLNELAWTLSWLLWIPMGLISFLGSFLLFPQLETSSNFIALQTMSGLKSVSYWASNLIFDMVLVVLGCSLMVIAFVAMLFALHMADMKLYFIAHFCLLLLVFFLAALPFTYLCSRQKTVAAGFCTIVLVAMFTGVIPTFVCKVLEATGSDLLVKYGKALKYVLLMVSSHFGLTYQSTEFAIRFVSNYNWYSMSNSEKRIYCMNKPDNPCCADNSSATCKNYLKFENSFYWDCLLMLGCGVMLFFVSVFMDSILRRKLQLANLYAMLTSKRRSDELDTVAATSDSGNDKQLVVDRLHKKYGNNEAVKDVTFTASKGYCLGLLGVNGAGKTTTFKMLTREIIQSSGTIRYSDKILSNGVTDSNKDALYQKNIGYCPQFDALNHVLSGRVLLETMALLKGITNPAEMAERFLELFDLKKYANQSCSEYSGGNKRKLCLAMSLIGSPEQAFLDEPTNGVDPSNRRRIWTIVNKLKPSMLLVLTSHSMSECEALCDDLAIMKSGKIEKSGTVAELKKSLGGYSFIIKLKSERPVSEDVDEVDGGGSEIDSVESLEAEMKKPPFENISLKDKHKSLLHYYVNDKNLRLSEIFMAMENIKSKSGGLVEDYTITEASLEEVFLSVAKTD